MSITPIRAVDVRELPFAPEEIWTVLWDVARYPQWWPRSVKVKVLGVTADVMGSELELQPRGGRAFRCRVESLIAPHRMTLRYGGGFISGTGEWRLDAGPNGTRVSYHLDVMASGRLVALLGHLLPLGKLHSQSMQHILECLECETRTRISHRAAG